MDVKKILVVDDEPDIVELASYNLTKEGFDVSSALDGEEALHKIRAGNFDLVILDLMLPGIQGMEICRLLRNDPRTQNLPVIMLTAKGEEIDRILGLEIGADDYMTKPFSPRELAARIRAILRRAGEKSVREKVIRIGDLVINLETYAVLKRAIPLNLSATEFKLLLYLVERRGRVFSREQLLDAVWKDEGFVEPRTVDVHIRRLRTQIEDDPSNPLYIKTKRGIGYYIDADI
ncbi:MAG TPA: DNA-binding response regulator [Nitrospiraceae bacterium]|jgi:phosphate regulon transcriptional regulator PhoB|nr:DNA-binding response regulator [Nitrospiraceae bacterium]